MKGIVISLFALFAVASAFIPQQACDALVSSYQRICSGNGTDGDAEGGTVIIGGSGTVITSGTDRVIRIESPSDPDVSELPECKPQMPPVSFGYCPMKYNDKCFWIVPRYDNVKFEEGKKICEDQGGMPANIYSEDHHYMVLGHLRVFAVKGGFFDGWTGMTYGNESRTTYLSYGTVAPYVKWYSGDPSTKDCCNIAIMARLDWDSVSQHMYTWPPTKITKGVICEK